MIGWVDGWMGAATASVCLFSVFGSRPPAKQGSAATYRLVEATPGQKAAVVCSLNIGFGILHFPQVGIGNVSSRRSTSMNLLGLFEKRTSP